MRKIAFVLASSLSLAGCEPTVSTLLLPMEPTPESVEAPRRALTDAEKDLISEAVETAMKGSTHNEFQWAPLVLRSHDRVTDYCGRVSGNAVEGRLPEFSEYYAQLSFDDHGKLTKVDVRSIAKSKSDNLPTTVDSICMQDGYVVFSAAK